MENTIDINVYTKYLFQDLESKVQYSQAQFWSVRKNQSGYFLSASGHPCYETERNEGLIQYRMDCVQKDFFVGEKGRVRWLPGLVVQTGLPQCTRNVQTDRQYPQLKNVTLMGCWALPVFPTFGQPNCVIGVIELITTAAKGSYDDDFTIFNSLRRELEVVNLKSSTVTIKVQHRDENIRFELSFWSDRKELLEQVEKRLVKLKEGTYKIKFYDDDDDDWVLIACDEDLQECITSRTSVGKIKTPIKMLIQGLKLKEENI